ncbi:MAG: hypothetical protein ABL958_15080, partial [Bdellovibrionia bacterium]
TSVEEIFLAEGYCPKEPPPEKFPLGGHARVAFRLWEALEQGLVADSRAQNRTVPFFTDRCPCVINGMALDFTKVA